MTASQCAGRGWLCWGVAFKRDVDDTRESPALDVLGLLAEKGPTSPTMTRLYHVFGLTDGTTLDSSPLTPDFLHEADCVVVITDHKTIDWQFVIDHCSLVVDTRHVTVKMNGQARVISL